MNVKKRLVLGRYGRTIILVLLTPITTLNASQVMTFCVGRDGHIALELLVQDRCTCELRPRKANARPADMADSSRALDESGLLCVDIPVPGGSSDDRMRTRPAPTDEGQRQTAIGGFPGLPGAGLLSVTATAAQPGGPDGATQSLLASVAYHTALDSILLQV